eukprot:TRINITY_DN29176_c0_g1_i1.p1 TRINITY_DN29176_c0_g1~~TRINITY_DN29176_c0_g1_i1.p1  ORF type:complete len:466 (+),score=64.52 TRINITY_DN29176_c0_g1_i1:71-1468(+)
MQQALLVVAMLSLVPCVDGSKTPLRILLLGEASSSKGEVGNMILSANAFNETADAAACLPHSAAGRLFGQGTMVELIDVGNLDAVSCPGKEVGQQIQLHALSPQGIHAIIYVHSACEAGISAQTEGILSSLLHGMARNISEKDFSSRVAIAFTNCLERKPLYHWFLARMNESNPSLPSISTFWIDRGQQNWAGYILGAMRETFGLGWKGQFSTWVNNLPTEPVKVPEQASLQHASHTERTFADRLAVTLTEARGNGKQLHTLGYKKYFLPCFTDQSTVMVQGRGRVRMAELQVGNIIETLGGWTEVLAWMHREQISQGAEALALSSSAGVVLEITADHYVYLERAGKHTAIPAREVAVGDTLLINASGIASRVTSIKRVRTQNVYAPLTTSGTLLVDGVLVSCYADIGLPHDIVHFCMNGLTFVWRLLGRPEWMRPKSNSDWNEAGQVVKLMSDVPHLFYAMLLK